MLQGLWQSQGYGWILAFGEAGYTLHHVTRVNCLAAEHGSQEDFRHSYERMELEEEQILGLRQAGDITCYRFRRIPGLPAVPLLSTARQDDSPLLNFETLWHAFDEHYAFFDLHGVDWQEVGRRERGRAQRARTPEELFTVFSDMLAVFDDGHVSLTAPGRLHQRMRGQDLRGAMQAVFATPTLRVTPRASIDSISAKLEEVVLAPLSRKHTPLRRACNDILSWCVIEPGIGYLNVLRLFGFADSEAARRANDLPHLRRAVADFLRDDMAALEAALDAAFRELDGCRALIIDLRINGGGFDRAGLAIASRLADRRRLAFSKCARSGDGHTPRQPLHVEAAAAPFTRPVVVLTSPLCVSAGEILTLALRALPQVVVMGQPTAGILSDNLNKPLPNGWELSLSNEIYTSSDGQVFEGRGIAPDVPAVAMDAAQFVPALRKSLLAALDLIERGAPAPERHRAA